MNRLAIYLNQHLDGVVYSAPNILAHYATDRSLLRYYPRVVAVPENVTDVRRLVQFSNLLARKKISLPITVRGAGQGKTGAALSSGIVLSTERLNRIAELDSRQRLIRVQCGVTLGELKKALLLYGLDLPVFGNPAATIGGLISEAAPASNNTAPRTILDFIEEAEIVLSDGSLLQAHRHSKRQLRKKQSQKDFEGSIYQALFKLYSSYAQLPYRLPPIEVNKSAYPGFASLKNGLSYNLAPIFAGAEGSLGIITEVILRCEPVFDTPDYFAIICENATAFAKTSALLKKLKFTDQEVYDTELFDRAASTGKNSRFFRKPKADGYLILANAKDDSKRLRRQKLRRLKKTLPSTVRFIPAKDDHITDFTLLRANLSAYLNDTNSAGACHLPLSDGAYIPPVHQAEFLDGVTALAKDLKLALAVFGLADFNLFTVRPSFAPNLATDRQAAMHFLRQYLALIKKCKGSPCGAAAEGRFLATFARPFFDAESLRLAGEIKKIFDPFDILNPGIKHEVEPRAVLKHFRTDYNSGLLSVE